MRIFIGLNLRNLLGLMQANIMRACRISSRGVSPKSLKNGLGIEVLSGSYIDSSSSIGSYTYVGRNSQITKSTIGRYCSIANNVSIGQGEHQLNRISTSSVFYDKPWEILTQAECTIGSDVWIGVDAVVLRGVNVGVGAVIAANAVVTKNVPPYAIVGGIPARVIRYRMSENQRQTLLASRWWEKEPKEAAILMDRLRRELMLP